MAEFTTTVAQNGVVSFAMVFLHCRHLATNGGGNGT